ncbi:hypothetical protein An16g05240 [Aspergillus niger]|uniref:Uncharacterized protein n=2 Tax=Aspergillus niger TaxID=5061 RepID=A2R7Z0_ASPNC|nr:hypothetical protein An16g05240 [Aspergillus niger]CAK97378.1 hypothetical protein An16g05240 [Aspergillus niger]
MVLCIVGGSLQQVLKLAFLGSETDPLASFCATQGAYRTGRWASTARSVSSCTWTCQLHAGIRLTATGDFLGSFSLLDLFVPLSVRCILGDTAEAGNTQAGCGKDAPACERTHREGDIPNKASISLQVIARPKRAILTKQRVPYNRTTPDLA